MRHNNNNNNVDDTDMFLQAQDDPNDDDGDADDYDDSDPSLTDLDPDAIAEQLQQMISPHLGSVLLRDHHGTSGGGADLTLLQDEDPQAWLDRDDDDEDQDSDAEYYYDASFPEHQDESFRRSASTATGSTTRTTTGSAIPQTPTRPPHSKLSHGRAHTPVMSNASSSGGAGASRRKQPAAATPAASARTAATTPHIPFNVQSPWTVFGSTAATPAQRRGGTAARSSSRATPAAAASSISSDHAEYRDCMRCLEQFVRQKRHVAEQRNNWEQQRALLIQQGAPTPNIIHTDATISQQQQNKMERDAELEWLSQMNRLAWSKGRVVDGNFWMLLRQLRRVGLDAVVWNDDNRNYAVLPDYVAQMAQTNVDRTPQWLLQQFYPNAPLPLRRRQCLVQWLEICQNHVLDEDATTTRAMRHRAGKMLPSPYGWVQSDQDPVLIRSSLELLLAGRWDEALHLCRDSHAPHLAALWCGGEPQGYRYLPDGSYQETGNAQRPLWRWMMRQLAERQQQSSNRRTEDSSKIAITALLATHMKIALDCAALRTWEKGLYVVLKCPLDRLEDELLHQHNNHRRKCRPPYPGTQFAKQERDNLQCTSDLVDMLCSEARAVVILEASPFPEMRRENCWVTKAMSAFVVGHEGLRNLVHQSTQRLDQLTASELRLFTHAALYLHSLLLGASNSIGSLTGGSVLDEDLRGWKNTLVSAYVQHMSQREDLWYLVVFYTTLLPSDRLMYELPRLLARVERAAERETMMGQMHEHLSRNEALQVLRRTVDLALHEEPNGDDDNDVGDSRKMSVILWLCLDPQHRPDALVAANTLLRQFYRRGALGTAGTFLDHVFPSHVLVEAGEVGENNDNDSARLRVEQAQAEHAAFQAFHRQAHAVKVWQNTVARVHPVPGEASTKGSSQWTSTAAEAQAEKTLQLRTLVTDKRRAFQRVIDAANAAETVIRGVLQHEGGWLFTDDDEPFSGMDADDAEQGRRDELNQIRRQYLPQTVLLYHDVCVQTAAWMALALNDAVEQYETYFAGDEPCNAYTTMLQHLDPGFRAGDGASPMMPRFWTQKALQVAVMADSSEYTIRQALTVDNHKEILRRLAETTVLDLKYQAAWINSNGL